MGNSTIPNFAVPLARGYKLKRGKNLIGTPVVGGIFRTNLDQSLEAVEINVIFAFTNIQKAAFFDWFDSNAAQGGINHGANSFKIPLETDTGGVEDHQALFKPDTIDITTVEGINFRVACVLVVETTPSQGAPFGGSLWPLVEEYGEELQSVLDRLAKLTNIDFLVLK